MRLLYLIILLVFLGCTNNNYLTLSEDANMYNIVPENSFVELSDEEFQSVKRIIKESYDKNKNLLKSFHRYQFQLYPYLNNNQKEVWVNGFCRGENSSKDARIIFDGGNCYFQMILNLETNECKSIIVNGQS